MFCKEIKLEYRKNLTVLNGNWEKLFFFFLLSKLSDSTNPCSLYAEYISEDNLVSFYLSRGDYMTKKVNKEKPIIQISKSKFIKFLVFLGRYLELGDVTSIFGGILLFEAKNKEQKCTLFFRRSSILTSFLQMDTFKTHL